MLVYDWNKGRYACTQSLLNIAGFVFYKIYLTSVIYTGYETQHLLVFLSFKLFYISPDIFIYFWFMAVQLINAKYDE